MWSTRWRRLWRSGVTEGQSVILFALMLPVLAGLTGLAVDGGMVYLQRRQLQSIADVAALTGAQQANFNADNPQIRGPEASTDATYSAQTNGLRAGDILTVNVPPASGPFAGDPQYIEVIVTRTVPHSFMGVFGQTSAPISARAVARCLKPGYGSPAILALSQDPSAIRFAGGGSSGVHVDGDIISNGGIDSNGNASNFQITGGAYAVTGDTPNVTASLGAYGADAGPVFPFTPDPVEMGAAASPPTVIWPDFDAQPPGVAEVCREVAGVEVCLPDTGNVTVGSNEEAEFEPGSYGDVRIQGDVELEGGIYVFQSLDMSGGGTLTDNGEGVLIYIINGGLAVDVSGGVEFTVSAIQPNDWMDITIYAASGDIDLTGNGEREVQGSVYAPNGTVSIAGDGGDAIVYGQVIAQEVVFSGNGPTVDYSAAGSKFTFGPVLVNTPNSGG